MKNNPFRKILIVISAVILGILLFSLWVNVAASDIEFKTGKTISTSTGPDISPAQNAWIDKLEMCESGGDPTAINLVDLDGTSSFYSFQFKPDTFRIFGELYGVIPKGLSKEENMTLLKERKLQRDIVSFMILDKKTNWEQQFPSCVTQLGRPPKF